MEDAVKRLKRMMEKDNLWDQLNLRNYSKPSERRREKRKRSMRRKKSRGDR